jgi:hypothetical protein
MTTFTEGPRTAEFLISEANGHRSRDTVTLSSALAAALLPGAVLGKLTADGSYTTYDPTKSDGSQTVAAILFEGGAAGDERTVVNCDAEVKASKLTWFSGATANQKATGVAALVALGVKVR